MTLEVLQIVWFILYAILLIGYAILDGFDLGIGALSLFAKDENERAIHMNAIAPVWDGNEVWLLTAGGALFAAFPPVSRRYFQVSTSPTPVAGRFQRRLLCIRNQRILKMASFLGLAFGIGSLFNSLWIT